MPAAADGFARRGKSKTPASIKVCVVVCYTLGKNSKPISIDDDSMLRKDGNGTSMVAIAKYPATHTKAMPKYVASNLRGPKLVWLSSKGG